MRRTFIVGCPRSGSTVIRSALARHPALLAPPETALFERLHGDAARRWGDLDAHHESAPLRQRLGFTRKHHRELYATLQAWLSTTPTSAQRAPLRIQALKQCIVALLDDAARARQKTMWLESSPSHLLYMRDIDRLLPDARYVHVIRRGTDVLASLLDACLLLEDRAGFGGGVMRWARRWTYAMQIHHAHAEHARHYLLFIDDLFEQPQEEWRRLCRFLDIDAQPLLAHAGHDAAVEPMDAHEAWTLGFRHLPRHRIEALLSPSMQRWLHDALTSYDQLRDDIHRARGIDAAHPPAALTGSE